MFNMKSSKLICCFFLSIFCGINFFIAVPSFALIDNDGDGYYLDAVPADCNDSDPNVHPGASEICDDKDNDCDGLTDEGLAGCWAKTGLSGGGTQINISVDPLNPDVVYTSSDMLGVYKSFDQGEHWQWSNRDVFYTQASGIGFDPADSNSDG
jgi:hypothetical protein